MSLADVSGTDRTPFSKHQSFYHGQFKKYSADLGNDSYILKLREKSCPEMPEVEFLSNQIASSLKLPVAEYYYIKFGNEYGFLTRKFISKYRPADLKHIYHFMTECSFSVETIINVIRKETNSPKDVATFVEVILYDALIGNHDRHGRNLAFLDTKGSRRLSPLYDNVSELSTEGNDFLLQAHRNPIGRIVTEKTRVPVMIDYVEEIARLGFLKIAEEFSKRVNISIIGKLIEESYCSDLMKKAMIKLVEERFDQLKSEIQNIKK